MRSVEVAVGEYPVEVRVFSTAPPLLELPFSFCGLSLIFKIKENTCWMPFHRARSSPRRVIFSHGESDRVLQATKGIVNDGLAFPILLGHRDVIDQLLNQLGLHLDQGVYFVCDGHINFNPTSEEVAEIAMLAASRVKQTLFPMSRRPWRRVQPPRL